MKKATPQASPFLLGDHIYYVGQFVTHRGARRLVTDIVHHHPGNRHYELDCGLVAPEWSLHNVSGLWPWWLIKEN
jgi:hypothetical protein